jgi:CheY-like chemotaxis protein
MKTVLVIDDNYEYRDALKTILEGHGLEVIDSDCPDSAYRMLRMMDAPDLILCDLHMPFTMGTNREEYKVSPEVGVKTVHELAWVYPETPVVALTALGQDELSELKRFIAPIPAYCKPKHMEELLKLVQGYLVSQEFGGVN